MSERRRTNVDKEMIQQARRLVVEFEQIIKDPRRILEAWMENAGAFDEAATRQEKAR